MLALGTPVPSFKLPDLDGIMRSPEEFRNAPALLVAFICPHCPFARHVRQGFSRFAKEYQERGLVVFGINSNDELAFPDDGLEGMKKEAVEAAYTFPYLRDETQVVAQAFRAACTPDLFLFNRDGKLVYRGQFDDSRPGNDKPVDGADLRAATDAVLAGHSVPEPQKPSIGCNIKWKPGNEPDYFRNKR
jgi:peroxiredoxin